MTNNAVYLKSSSMNLQTINVGFKLFLFLLVQSPYSVTNKSFQGSSLYLCSLSITYIFFLMKQYFLLKIFEITASVIYLPSCPQELISYAVLHKILIQISFYAYHVQIWKFWIVLESGSILSNMECLLSEYEYNLLSCHFHWIC